MTSVEGILPPPPEELQEADPKEHPSSEKPTEIAQPSVPSADLTQSASTIPVVPTPVGQDTESTGTPNGEKDNPLDSPETAGAQAAPTEATQTPSVAIVNPQQAAYDNVTDQLFKRLAPVGLGDSLKVLYYGPPGGTKSTKLNIPHNLIYDHDGGLTSILAWHDKSGEPIAEDCEALPFTTFFQTKMLLERLQNKENIPRIASKQIISIDTINKLHAKMVMESSQARYNRLPESLRAATSPYSPETDDYTLANNRMMEIIDLLLGTKMHIILVAHQRSTDNKRNGTKIHPDFSESLANKIEAMMDVVCYLEMQEDANGVETPVARYITDGYIHAKNRIGLPALVSNPSYKDIMDRWLELKALQTN